MKRWSIFGEMKPRTKVFGLVGATSGVLCTDLLGVACSSGALSLVCAFLGATAVVSLLMVVRDFPDLESNAAYFGLAEEPSLRSYMQRVMELGVDLMHSTLDAVRNTDGSIAAYTWQTWLIAYIPASLISGIMIELFGPRIPDLSESIVDLITTWWFGPLLLAGAWIETLVMLPILFVLKRALGNSIWVPLVSGLIWGGMHFHGGSQWGVSQVWGFFVLSVCFLEWEKKSKAKAILVTSLVHMSVNLVPFLKLKLLEWTFF